MSNSLNRMSLDLVNLGAKMEYERKKKNRCKRVLDLIPSNRKIVVAKRKSVSSGASRHTEKICIVKNNNELDHNRILTEEKIHSLLSLSSNYVDVNITKELFKRAVEKRPIPQDKPQEEEKTAFTEDDFNNFAKEYSVIN